MIIAERDESVRIERLERARFERYCVPGRGGCIEWVGTKRRDGYGLIRFRGKTVTAHRAAWLMERGDIAGRHVLHSCDNPSCVNPEHLFVGTHTDNMCDMTRKGRHSGAFVGHKNPKAELSDAQVRAIRHRLARGETGAELAREYGVTRQAIYAIGARRTWKHVV